MPFTGNPVRARSALARIHREDDESPTPARVISGTPMRPIESREIRSSPDSSDSKSRTNSENWSDWKRLQREAHNLTTFCPENGIRVVRYPCSNDGTPVPASLFWRVTDMMEFEPLECFHGLVCKTFKCRKPGINAGHFVVACLAPKPRSCGYWASVTEIVRNTNGYLKTKIYKNIEPTFESQIRQALELSERTYEAETARTPVSRRRVTASSRGLDASPSSEASTTSSSRRSLRGTASPANTTSPVSDTSEFSFTLVAPLSSPVDSDQNDNSFEAEPSWQRDNLKKWANGECDGLAVVTRMALGISIPLRDMLETVQRCYSCRSIHLNARRVEHEADCSRDAVILRDSSYNHPGDATFDLAAPHGLPVASFDRFYRVCHGCQMVFWAEKYPGHACDLTY